MRIVIDLQSAQGLSKNRGMGRYSLALAQAMARVGRDHEIWIALNGLFPDTVEPIRKAFEGLAPSKRIVVWEAPGPVAAHDPASDWRRETSELIREAFLASLKPDIVWVTSLFEGLSDDSLTSIAKGPEIFPTAVTLYDLIPLLFEEAYLGDPQIRTWYYQKLQWLRNADLWLAVSESTRQDAIDRIGLSETRVLSISAACTSIFQPTAVDQAKKADLRSTYGVTSPFVLHVGGTDNRKNVESLIMAFGSLSHTLLQNLQLVIAGSIQEHQRRRFAGVVHRAGLKSNRVLFTGFIPEEDLIALYNLCKLFVFPSLYEGFGLPALEAMACGAPVVASDTSSLPEVVGWEKALFDPSRPEAITDKMEEALTNEPFRKALKKHGLQQAKGFSWEESARRALKAFEDFHHNGAKGKSAHIRPTALKPTLAYVSPLPPARSGIADYSRELLPELAKYYQLELIVDQPEISDAWLLANFPIRTSKWFDKNADKYDRILYQFGNSFFHKHMFALLEKQPGVVVLHDFYLSGVIHWMEQNGYTSSGSFARELYRSHGYGAVAEFAAHGENAAILKYPCSLNVIERADGCLFHSKYALRLADAWYDDQVSRNAQLVPALRSASTRTDRSAARKELGYRDTDVLVCSFGSVATTKACETILDAWLTSKLGQSSSCYLVYVGHVHDQGLRNRLESKAKHAEAGNRLRLTGSVSVEAYELYLSAADIAVQLRSVSRGETSRSVLDCLAHGLPTIVNGHGSMAELPDGVVLMLPHDADGDSVAVAMDELGENTKLRQCLSETGLAYVKSECNPRKVAEQYFAAIEHFADDGMRAGRRRLIRAIARQEKSKEQSDSTLGEAAAAVSANFDDRLGMPELLVDVSRWATINVVDGIQRVTSKVVKELLKTPPQGMRTEPVYGIPPACRYARALIADFLQLPLSGVADGVVRARKGDIFLGLDWRMDLARKCQGFFSGLRTRYVPIYFVLYDLLPLLHRNWFPPNISTAFNTWLTNLAQVSDGIICISESVAAELADWLDYTRPNRDLALKIGFFHLGAGITDTSHQYASLENGPLQKALASEKRVFLMVGTIEPRKGYDQALEAFEHLWGSNEEVSLVLVGRQGWMVERLADRLRTHQQLGTRLFWLEGTSDATLIELYRRSTALLMASQGEGFGLPLIEAARHGLRIIARDIPVFREVCGEHALYFTGNDAEDLADAIRNWLDLDREGGAPSVEGMKVLTWEESTKQLRDVIFGDNWYRTWDPGADSKRAS